MMFFDYPSMYEFGKNEHVFTNPNDFYMEIINGINSNVMNKLQIDETLSERYAIYISEWTWWMQKRPYYKAWPSIVDSLQKLSLDIDVRKLNLPKLCVSIRFCGPDGLVVDGNQRIFSIFVSNTTFGNSSDTFLVVGYYGHEINYGSFIEYFTPIPLCMDLNLENTLRKTRNIHVYYPVELNIDKTKCDNKTLTAPISLLRIIKIAVTILLLHNDPSIIQPDVLAADRQRFDESTDPILRQRLIDKARKRGIVGWRIGEQYETIPHFRRPHPALYHVGKGRNGKRIVFRAGAIVHRQKMTEVPTGYMEEDGTEVEQ